MTPSIRRLLETALYADDVARTATFYENLLGRAPMLQSERLVAIDAGEATVLLIFHRGHAQPLPTAGGRVPGHDAAARFTSRSRSADPIWCHGNRGSGRSEPLLRAG